MSSQLQVTGEAKIRDIQGPVVANSGVITALDGDASQYVRGDGTLADFPTSTGGGSSVSYYLNSSVSQGTIGGVAYRQLGKTPIIGAGTDITISANGYVASYITDANDPALLEVPAGNFNCEFYFSVNSNSHNPFVYAEVYKYDGTTFSLIGTSVGVPEYLSNGTTLSPYYFAIPVTQTTLAITDRIAIRIYVNVDTRVVTLHTENNHLCQVVTTFSKGLTSLNNLTRQVQFLATGTSGTDFGIVSSVATHTFNLPIASATNTGKLSSTDWSTFNNKVPYTGATTDVDLGTFNLSTLGTLLSKYIYVGGNGTNSGFLSFSQYATPDLSGTNATSIYTTSNNKVNFRFWQSGVSYKTFNFDVTSLTTSTERTFTLPDLSGTLALLEGTQTFSGSKTFSNTTLVNTIYIDGVSYLKHLTSTSYITGYTTYSAKANGIIEYFFPSSFKSILDFNDAADYTYTFPAASGTLALTSDLGAYVTLATAQTISGTKTFGSSVTINTAGQSILSIVSSAGNSSDITSSIAGVLKSTISTSATEFKLISAIDNILKFQSSTNFRASLIFSNTADYSYTYPNASGTIALTSQLPTYGNLTSADTSQLIVTGGTGAVIGAGTSITLLNASATNGGIVSAGTQTFAGAKTFSSSVTAGGNITSGTGAFNTGGFFIPYSTSSASSRNWKITNDQEVFGDFSIKQSSTQTGLPDTYRLYISAVGNVGIGTSSPNTYSAFGTGIGLDVASSTTNAPANINIVGNGSGYAGLNLGNATIRRAGIFAEDGSILTFYTNGSNSGTSVTERMRITSGGYLKASNNGTYINASGNFHEFNNNAADWVLQCRPSNASSPLGINVTYNNAAPNNTGNEFLSCNDNTAARIALRSNGGIANFQANNVNLSDERTKKDIIPLESYWDKFKAIEIVKFKYKDQTHDDFNIGVIAQQVEKVAPEFVDIDGFGKDTIPEDGIPLKTIYTADLHHATIKVLQECMSKIEELKAEIEQLKAKIK
jgi:hypothetical protein